MDSDEDNLLLFGGPTNPQTLDATIAAVTSSSAPSVVVTTEDTPRRREQRRIALATSEDGNPSSETIIAITSRGGNNGGNGTVVDGKKGGDDGGEEQDEEEDITFTQMMVAEGRFNDDEDDLFGADITTTTAADGGAALTAVAAFGGGAFLLAGGYGNTNGDVDDLLDDLAHDEDDDDGDDDAKSLSESSDGDADDDDDALLEDDGHASDDNDDEDDEEANTTTQPPHDDDGNGKGGPAAEDENVPVNASSATATTKLPYKPRRLTKAQRATVIHALRTRHLNLMHSMDANLYLREAYNTVLSYVIHFCGNVLREEELTCWGAVADLGGGGNGFKSARLEEAMLATAAGLSSSNNNTTTFPSFNVSYPLKPRNSGHAQALLLRLFIRRPRYFSVNILREDFAGGGSGVGSLGLGDDGGGGGGSGSEKSDSDADERNGGGVGANHPDAELLFGLNALFNDEDDGNAFNVATYASAKALGGGIFIDVPQALEEILQYQHGSGVGDGEVGGGGGGGGTNQTNNNNGGLAGASNNNTATGPSSFHPFPQPTFPSPSASPWRLIELFDGSALLSEAKAQFGFINRRYKKLIDGVIEAGGNSSTSNAGAAGEADKKKASAAAGAGAKKSPATKGGASAPTATTTLAANLRYEQQQEKLAALRALLGNRSVSSANDLRDLCRSIHSQLAFLKQQQDRAAEEAAAKQQQQQGKKGPPAAAPKKSAAAGKKAPTRKAPAKKRGRKDEDSDSEDEGVESSDGEDAAVRNKGKGKKGSTTTAAATKGKATVGARTEPSSAAAMGANNNHFFSPASSTAAAATSSAPSAMFSSKERCLAFLCYQIDVSIAKSSADTSSATNTTAAAVADEFTKLFASSWDLLLGRIIALTPMTKHYLTTLYQLFDLVNRFDPRRALDQHVMSAHSNSTSAHSGGHSAGTPGAKGNQMALTVGVGASAAAASTGGSKDRGTSPSAAAKAALLASKRHQSVLSCVSNGGSNTAEPITLGEYNARMLFRGEQLQLTDPADIAALGVDGNIQLRGSTDATRCLYACQGPLLDDLFAPRDSLYYDRAFVRAAAAASQGGGITSAVMMGKIGLIGCPMRHHLPKKVVLAKQLLGDHSEGGCRKASLPPPPPQQHPARDGGNGHSGIAVLEHQHTTLLFPPLINDPLLSAKKKEEGDAGGDEANIAPFANNTHGQDQFSSSSYQLPNFYIFSCRDALDVYLEGAVVLNDLVAVGVLGALGPVAAGGGGGSNSNSGSGGGGTDGAKKGADTTAGGGGAKGKGGNSTGTSSNTNTAGANANNNNADSGFIPLKKDREGYVLPMHRRVLLGMREAARLQRMHQLWWWARKMRQQAGGTTADSSTHQSGGGVGIGAAYGATTTSNGSSEADIVPPYLATNGVDLYPMPAGGASTCGLLGNHVFGMGRRAEMGGVLGGGGVGFGARRSASPDPREPIGDDDDDTNTAQPASHQQGTNVRKPPPSSRPLLEDIIMGFGPSDVAVEASLLPLTPLYVWCRCAEFLYPMLEGVQEHQKANDWLTRLLSEVPLFDVVMPSYGTIVKPLCGDLEKLDGMQMMAGATKGAGAAPASVATGTTAKIATTTTVAAPLQPLADAGADDSVMEIPSSNASAGRCGTPAMVVGGAMGGAVPDSPEPKVPLGVSTATAAQQPPMPMPMVLLPSLWDTPTIPPVMLAEPLAPKSVGRYIRASMPHSLRPIAEGVAVGSGSTTSSITGSSSSAANPLALSLLKVPYRYHKRGFWWFRLAWNTANYIGLTDDKGNRIVAKGVDTPAVKLKKAANSEKALGIIETLLHDLTAWRQLEEEGVRKRKAWEEKKGVVGGGSAKRPSSATTAKDPLSSTTAVLPSQDHWASSMMGAHVTAMNNNGDAIYGVGLADCHTFPFTAAHREAIAVLERFLYGATVVAGAQQTSTISQKAGGGKGAPVVASSAAMTMASITSFSSQTTTAAATITNSPNGFNTPSAARAATNYLWMMRKVHYCRRADLIECERVYIKYFVPPRRWGEPSRLLLSLHLRQPTKVFVRGRRHERGGWVKNDVILTSKTTTTEEFVHATQATMAVTTRTVLKADVSHQVAAVNVEELSAQWYRSGCGKRPTLQPVKGLFMHATNAQGGGSPLSQSSPLSPTSAAMGASITSPTSVSPTFTASPTTTTNNATADGTTAQQVMSYGSGALREVMMACGEAPYANTTLAKAIAATAAATTSSNGGSSNPLLNHAASAVAAAMSTAASLAAPAAYNHLHLGVPWTVGHMEGWWIEQCCACVVKAFTQTPNRATIITEVVRVVESYAEDDESAGSDTHGSSEQYPHRTPTSPPTPFRQADDDTMPFGMASSPWGKQNQKQKVLRSPHPFYIRIRRVAYGRKYCSTASASSEAADAEEDTDTSYEEVISNIPPSVLTAIEAAKIKRETAMSDKDNFDEIATDGALLPTVPQSQQNITHTITTIARAQSTALPFEWLGVYQSASASSHHHHALLTVFRPHLDLLLRYLEYLGGGDGCGGDSAAPSNTNTIFPSDPSEDIITMSAYALPAGSSSATAGGGATAKGKQGGGDATAAVAGVGAAGSLRSPTIFSTAANTNPTTKKSLQPEARALLSHVRGLKRAAFLQFVCTSGTQLKGFAFRDYRELFLRSSVGVGGGVGSGAGRPVASPTTPFPPAPPQAASALQVASPTTAEGGANKPFPSASPTSLGVPPTTTGAATSWATAGTARGLFPPPPPLPPTASASLLAITTKSDDDEEETSDAPQIGMGLGGQLTINCGGDDEDDDDAAAGGGGLFGGLRAGFASGWTGGGGGEAMGEHGTNTAPTSDTNNTNGTSPTSAGNDNQSGDTSVSPTTRFPPPPPASANPRTSSTPFGSFEQVMSCIPMLPLSRLLRCMLLSPPTNGFGMKFNGFPDLICWYNSNPCFTEEVMGGRRVQLGGGLGGRFAGEADARFATTSPRSNRAAPQPAALIEGYTNPIPLYIEPLFLGSEVKSPNDQLSEKQLTVNDVLLRCGFLVHVLHVIDAGREDQDSMGTVRTAAMAATGQLLRVSSANSGANAGGGGTRQSGRTIAAPLRRVPTYKEKGSATNPMRLDE